MSHIQSVSDLKKEIRRLEALKIEQEAAISSNVREINESLRPVTMVFNTLSRFISPVSSEGGSPFLKKGIDIGLGFLIDRFLLRNSSGVTKVILSALARNITSGFINKNSGALMDKIKGIFSSIKEKFSPTKETYDEREIYNDY